MSNDRRRQRRRQRQRRGTGYEPAGAVKFPGIFGWLQRSQRTFFAVGILVLLGSLGGGFLATQMGSSGTDRGDDSSQVSEKSAATATVVLGETATAIVDPDAIVRSYSEPPALTIDLTHRFEALIHTERGDVLVELLGSEAPGYVNNFVFLARNRFFDGLTFHRVVPGFVAQSGDPTATGFSSSGYDLVEETNELPFEAGVISMAKAGPIVSGSQFFITLEPQLQLKDSGFTVFGRVLEGLDILRSLSARDPQQAGIPPGDRIISIEIIEQAN